MYRFRILCKREYSSLLRWNAMLGLFSYNFATWEILFIFFTFKSVINFILN